VNRGQATAASTAIDAAAIQNGAVMPSALASRPPRSVPSAAPPRLNRE